MKPISKRKFLQLLRNKDACPEGYDLAKGYLKKHTVEQLVEYYYRCKVWRDRSYSSLDYYSNYCSIKAERGRNLNWLALTLHVNDWEDNTKRRLLNAIREACK